MTMSRNGSGSDGTPYATPGCMSRQDLPPRPRLTDAEIRDIAEQIVRAVAAPRPDNPRDDICSRMHELPPEEEGRVIAVLKARRSHD